MGKKSFFNRQNTAITALFSGASVADLVARTRTAAAQGADGIAIELHDLPPEQRTVDNFRAIIAEAPLPFMFICYRRCPWFGNDDEGRQEGLLRAAEAGAEVIDVMGDLFAQEPGELTLKPEAIARQRALIERIHERGTKVVMSSHRPTLPPLSAGEIMDFLKLQAERGADICKLVSAGDTEEAFLEAIRADLALGKSFPKPFIHLLSGKFSKPQRFLGTKLGLAATFGVTDYSLPEYNQPLITSLKIVRDTIPWDVSDVLGTV